MLFFRRLRHNSASILVSLLMTLQMSACSTEDDYLTSNNTTVISGDDSGSVTEDDDPDNDNLLEVSGKLDITNIDPAHEAFIATDVTVDEGSFTIDVDGNWSFAADNNLDAIQGLVAGETVTQDLTVSSIDGTKHTITITIHGTDDTAVISGDVSGNVTKDVDPDNDNLLEVSGKLDITDNDAGQAAFIAAQITGNYGSFTIDVDGNWSYSADNTQPSIQNLAGSITLRDDMTVNSIDGTSFTVLLSISAANNIPTFTGDDTGNLTEGVDPDSNGLLETAGKLSVVDLDLGESFFIDEQILGNFGSLTINANGDWSYSANINQMDISSLPDSATLTDTIEVRSVDQTPHSIVITITGVANAAVISGDDSGSVTEDVDPDNDNLLEVSGKLDISDDDPGEEAFTAETISGVYGDFTIAADGNWSYSANNDQTVIQDLVNGVQLTDDITVSSNDGTTHPVQITISSLDMHATLSWTPPTQREDDTVLLPDDIAGYSIYYGTTQGGPYDNTINIDIGSATEYAFKELSPDTYYVVMTARDTAGLESQYSSPEKTITP